MVNGMPLTYIVVPSMEYVIFRVRGHHANKRELVSAVRSGRTPADRVRSGHRVLWSKARVRREFLPA